MNFYKTDIEIAQDFMHGFNARKQGFHCYSKDVDFMRGYQAAHIKDTAEASRCYHLLQNRTQELALF